MNTLNRGHREHGRHEEHSHSHGQEHSRGEGSRGGKNNGGGYGPGGYCICAKCGTKIQHQSGTKCTTIRCPECNTPLIREELLEAKRNPKK